MGIHPTVTLHHFSNPVWVDDPRRPTCDGGPSDTNLCGLGSAGGREVIAEMTEHAGFVAEKFGDLVDDWGTLNEPINYLLAAYGIGSYPPGKSTIGQITTAFVAVGVDRVVGLDRLVHLGVRGDVVAHDGDERRGDLADGRLAGWIAADAVGGEQVVDRLVE